MKHLNQKAMLAKLEITQWSGLKKDRSVNDVVQREFHTGANAGFYSKRLVEKELLTKIRSEGEKARKTLYKYSLPWQDDGARMLPAKNFIKCRDEIEKSEAKRNLLIIEFLENYEGMKETAKARLGDLYSEQDYPEYIEDRFGFQLSFMPVPNISDFRVEVNDEEMEAIKSSAENSVKSIVDKSVEDVYKRAKDLVGKIADVMSKGDQKFKSSIIDNVSEFVSLLPGLNVTENPQLTSLYFDLKEKIATLDAQEMRDNPLKRREAGKAAQDILNSMKGYC